MLCALIMAGGRGERFWPLSTDEKPKQFLNLLGNESMIQMTVNRLKKLIPIENIFIVTGKKYAGLVKEHIPNLLERNIIIEPVGRNTAPCIALSAFLIEKYYKNSTIVVVPADHQINDENKFLDTINSAYTFVEKMPDSVVTIGIKPDRPETGYGYIKVGETVEKIDKCEIKNVEKFVEKPDIEKARQYIEKGNYIWNAGMFVWKNETILKLTKQHLNETYNILNEIALTEDDKYDEILDEKYEKVDNISVDYGIMEHAENIYVIPSEFGWDDIGSWYAIERYRESDKNNNITSGDVNNIDARDNIIIGKTKPIIAVGVENLFVIEGDDVTLICNKDKIENIKEIKDYYIKGN